MRFVTMFRTLWSLFGSFFSRSRSNGSRPTPAPTMSTTAAAQSALSSVWDGVKSTIESNRGSIFGGNNARESVRQLLKRIPFGTILTAVSEVEAIPVVLGLILGNISSEFVTDMNARGLLKSLWKSFVVPTLAGTQNFDQTTWNGLVDGWLANASPASGAPGYLDGGPFTVCTGLGFAFVGSNPTHPFYLRLKDANRRLATREVNTLAEVEQAGAIVIAPGFDPLNSQFVYIRATSEYSDMAINVWLTFVRTDGIRYAMGGLENWLLAMLGADMGRELNTIPPNIMNALAVQMHADGSILANGTLTNEAYCTVYQTIRTLGQGEIEFMNQVKYALGRAVIWLLRDPNPQIVNGVQVPRPFRARFRQQAPSIAGWLAVIISVLGLIVGGAGLLLYGGFFLFGPLSLYLWFGDVDPVWAAGIMVVLVILEWLTLAPSIYLDRILDLLNIDEEDRAATPGIKSHALKLGIGFSVFVALLVISMVAMPIVPTLGKLGLMSVIVAVVGIGIYYGHKAIVKHLTIAVLAIAGVSLGLLFGWQLLHMPVPFAPKQVVLVRSVTYTHTVDSAGKSQVVVTEYNGAPFNKVPDTSRATSEQKAEVLQFENGSFMRYTNKPEDYHWYNLREVECPQGLFVVRCFVAQKTVLHDWFRWIAMPGDSYNSLSDPRLAEECKPNILEEILDKLSRSWFARVGLFLLVLGVLFKIISWFLPDDDEKAVKRQKSVSETGGSLIRWGLVSLFLLTPVVYVVVLFVEYFAR